MDANPGPTSACFLVRVISFTIRAFTVHVHCKDKAEAYHVEEYDMEAKVVEVLRQHRMKVLRFRHRGPVAVLQCGGRSSRRLSRVGSSHIVSWL